MTTLRQRIEEALAAQRWTASQASREASSAVLQANMLERAGELALLGRLAESKRVIELSSKH